MPPAAAPRAPRRRAAPRTAARDCGRGAWRHRAPGRRGRTRLAPVSFGLQRRDADADRNLSDLRKGEAFDGGAKTLERRQGFLDAAIRHQDDELLAAEAEQLVGVAKGLAHEAGEQHQHLVAVGMAEAVVDLLEKVDVGDAEMGARAGEVVEPLPAALRRTSASARRPNCSWKVRRLASRVSSSMSP